METLTELEFETKYLGFVVKYSNNIGISYSTALEDLHTEYSKCKTKADWNEWLDIIENNL